MKNTPKKPQKKKDKQTKPVHKKDKTTSRKEKINEGGNTALYL